MGVVYKAEDTRLALAGDQARAKLAYGEFLTLWKNADAGIPILVHAKAEYARLQ